MALHPFLEALNGGVRQSYGRFVALLLFSFLACVLEPVYYLRDGQSREFCHGLFVLLGWIGMVGMLHEPIL